MSQKFVTIDNNNIVQEVFDEANENVPDGAIKITDVELQALRNRDRMFSDFEIIGGVLQLVSGADDNRKTRLIDQLNSPLVIKAFMELMLDEINTLRAKSGLPPRTMTQFKTAMKNKLS